MNLDVTFSRHSKHRCFRDEDEILKEEVREIIEEAVPMILKARSNGKFKMNSCDVNVFKRSKGLNIVGRFETDGTLHSFVVLTIMKSKQFMDNPGTIRFTLI